MNSCTLGVCAALVLLVCRASAAPLQKGAHLQRVDDYDVDDSQSSEVDGVVGDATADDADLDQLPEYEPQTDDESHVINYLRRYGYLGTKFPSVTKVRHALSTFQHAFGLPMTGEFDDATLSATKVPRCSATDVQVRPTRSRRFVLTNVSRWNKKHFTGEHELTLKWYISSYPDSLPKSVVKKTVIDAFKVWSSGVDIAGHTQVKLIFHEASSEADSDINIKWAIGNHGDGEHNKFDGRGISGDNVLAHTFFPDYKPAPLNGDIHFDGADLWDTDPNKHDAQNLPYVLTHEIGHALGLNHARRRSSVMHMQYKNLAMNEIKLDIDDRCALHWNYVGSSQYCLFVWLLSEIVPLHNLSAPNLIQLDRLREEGPSRGFPKRDLHHTVERREEVKDVRLPRCLSSNNIQQYIINGMQNKLKVDLHTAQTNSVIMCNFLNGLHVYRGSKRANIDDSPEREFDAVREFANDPEGVKRLVKRAEQRQQHGLRSLLDKDHFTTEFFDKFFSIYNA